MQKSHYWAVFENKAEIFTGSFTECWRWLVENRGEYTVSYLASKGVKIARRA